jgi:hypothetical protein
LTAGPQGVLQSGLELCGRWIESDSLGKPPVA